MFIKMSCIENCFLLLVLFASKCVSHSIYYVLFSTMNLQKNKVYDLLNESKTNQNKKNWRKPKQVFKKKTKKKIPKLFRYWQVNESVIFALCMTHYKNHHNISKCSCLTSDWLNYILNLKRKIVSLFIAF